MAAACAGGLAAAAAALVLPVLRVRAQRAFEQMCVPAPARPARPAPLPLLAPLAARRLSPLSAESLFL